MVGISRVLPKYFLSSQSSIVHIVSTIFFVIVYSLLLKFAQIVASTILATSKSNADVGTVVVNSDLIDGKVGFFYFLGVALPIIREARK